MDGGKHWKRAGLCLMAGAYVAAVAAVGWRAWRARPPDRVTIRLSHWQLEGTVREGIEADIRRYEQLNPRVHVVALPVPGSIYIEWMRAQLAGGTAPDIMEYTMYWGHIQELALRYFQPLSREVARPNPYDRGTDLEKLPWRDTFIDGMNGPDGYVASLNDYYAPTLASFTLRVFYNRTLLREITGRDDPPRTWGEFSALCATVRDYAAAHHRVLFPVANSRANCQFMAVPVMAGIGGGVYPRIDHRHSLNITYEEAAASLVRGEWSYRTPQIADALEVFREIGNNSQPGFVQATIDVAMLYFLRGDALMFCSGSWDASSLRQQAGFEIGAFRLPLPDRRDPRFGRSAMTPLSDGIVQTAMAFYLNRASAHPAEAIDFLRFLTSREGDQIFVNVSQWLPATRGVRPTQFSEEYKPFYDGYCWDPPGTCFFGGTGVEATGTFLSEMNTLFGPNGSVAAMQAAMARRLPDAVDHDLDTYRTDARNAFTSEDAAYAADRSGPRGDRRLRAPPILREAEFYQIGELRGGSRMGAALRPADGLAETGAPASRSARFDRAAKLMAKQPVFESQVDQARAILLGLAAEGGDDTAWAARYFLGRIAQHFQAQPDPAEAARQYRLLLAAAPRSVWAQTALTRLGVLQVYALDPAAPPASRVAAAEKLSAAATDPEAASELHLLLEDAIFHYRLPMAGALPHLLAAEELGHLDPPTHADVLVQIAEVSGLLGDTARARAYYQKLLDEFPLDQRAYMVRLRLASLSH